MAKPTLSRYDLVVTRDRLVSFQRTDHPILRQGKTIPYEVILKGSTTYIQKVEIDRIDITDTFLDGGPGNSNEKAYRATVITDYQNNKRGIQVLLSGVVNHLEKELETLTEKYKKSIATLREVALEEMARNESV